MRSNHVLFALVVAGLTWAMVAPRAASAFVSPNPPPGFERGHDGRWRYRPPEPVRPGSGGLLPGGKLNVPKPGGGAHPVGVGFRLKPGAVGSAVGAALRRHPGIGVALGIASWLADECLKNKGGHWVISCGEDPDVDWGPWVEPYGNTRHGTAEAACRAGEERQSGREGGPYQWSPRFGGRDPDKVSSVSCCSDTGCAFSVYRSVIGDPEVIPDDELDRRLDNAPYPKLPTLPYEAEPIINPSPGPDPQPMPFRIPVGDPIPRVDPDTGRIDWVQPGLEMQQLGTPADPLRLDTRPVETPVAGPKGEELKPEKPAKPTTGTETPAPGGGGAPLDPDKLDPCKLHPDILACQKYGEIKEPPKMGEQLIQMDIRPYGGASAGSCPAPRQVSFFGRPLSISYQPICDFATMIRPLIIGLAYLSAALIFVGAARRN